MRRLRVVAVAVFVVTGVAMGAGELVTPSAMGMQQVTGCCVNERDCNGLPCTAPPDNRCPAQNPPYYGMCKKPTGVIIPGGGDF